MKTKKYKNRTYWNHFYKKFRFASPSNFAKFVFKKKYITKSDKLLEIGCGNGRDIFYFIKNGIYSYGLDKSSVAIQNNLNKVEDIFFKKDFCKIDKFLINFFKKKKLQKYIQDFFCML